MLTNQMYPDYLKHLTQRSNWRWACGPDVENTADLLYLKRTCCFHQSGWSLYCCAASRPIEPLITVANMFLCFQFIEFSVFITENGQSCKNKTKVVINYNISYIQRWPQAGRLAFSSQFHSFWTNASVATGCHWSLLWILCNREKCCCYTEFCQMRF